MRRAIPNAGRWTLPSSPKEGNMIKALCIGLALCAAPALFTTAASAIPLDRNVAAAASGDITLVRDGCGRGFRFSNRRQACVPVNREGYVDPGAAAAATAIGVIGAIVTGGHRHRGHARGHGHRSTTMLPPPVRKRR
jgi:hypothetical protein